MRGFALVCVPVLLLITAGFVTSQEKISRVDRTHMRETRETMRSVALSLRTLKQMSDDGAYPKKLKSLVDNKLEESVPKDAWGRDFAYEQSVEHGYLLTSWGADGKAGGKAGAQDIVWTQAGELRELSDTEKQAIEKKRAELRYQGRRAIARQRMIQMGLQAVSYRRDKDEWPTKLVNCKRIGNEPLDNAINLCLNDPWGHPFAFKQLPHENFAVICWGADGNEDGLGPDADFVITERDVRGMTQQDDFDFEWGGYYDDSDWQARNLARDVASYKQRFGHLPTELADLTRGGKAPNSNKVLQAIRNSLPNDRWGNDYTYVKLNDEDYHVIALGKDQLEGGRKDNEDAVYPKPGTVPDNEEWNDGAAVAPPVPQQDDDEVLAEVAREVMLDVVEKLKAHAAAEGAYPENLAAIADKFVNEEVPLDPWGLAFSYEITKDDDGAINGFTLTCYGSDLQAGGDDHAADIVMNQDGEPEPTEDEGDG